MKNGLILLISGLGLITLLWSCGKTKLNYDGANHHDNNPTYPQMDNLPPGMKSIKMRTGTLVLDEQPLVKSGKLNYSLYEDGTISYDGEVWFFGYRESSPLTYLYQLVSNGPGVVETFKGIIRVSPKLIDSNSYKTNASTLYEREVQFKNMGFSDYRTVKLQGSFQDSAKADYSNYGSPTDKNAVADIKIDVSSYIVDILDVTVNTRVFGVPVMLHAVKKRD